MTTHLIISIGTSIINKYNNSVPEEELVVDYPPGWSYQKVYTNETFPAPHIQAPLNYKEIASILKEKKYHGAEQSTFAKLKESKITG